MKVSVSAFASKMSTAKHLRIQNQKVPSTSSQSIIRFVTLPSGTYSKKLLFVRSLLISNVIDEYEKSVKVFFAVNWLWSQFSL